MKKYIVYLIMASLIITLAGCTQRAYHDIQETEGFVMVRSEESSVTDFIIEKAIDVNLQDTEVTINDSEENNEGCYVYKNESGGYLLKFPFEWKDQIEITEINPAGTNVAVNYKNKTVEHSAHLFSVILYGTLEEWNCNPDNESGFPYIKLDVKDNMVYAATGASDFPYDPQTVPQETIQEYQSMLEQVHEVVGTFSFIEE